MDGVDNFRAFGGEHSAALLILLATAVLLPLGVRRMNSPRALAAGRWTLGATLLGVKLGELIHYLSAGADWRWLLPLHLCDLAAFIAVGALWSGRQRLYELGYYWAMGGTVQALLTPDLRSGFPSLDFWLFFVPHGLVILSVCYATGALGMRPGPGSVLRAFLATLAACVPAALANWRFGTNYMYLREKPGAASLLDFLGPWPWYILSCVPVGFVLLLIVYSPFWWDARRGGGPGTG